MRTGRSGLTAVRTNTALATVQMGLDRKQPILPKRAGPTVQNNLGFLILMQEGATEANTNARRMVPVVNRSTMATSYCSYSM